MTALTDFIDIINDWTNYDDPVSRVTSFVRMAEDRINLQMRIADMIQIDTGVLVTSRVLLPKDWIQADFIQDVEIGPLRYMTRDEFFTFPANGTKAANTAGMYTILGNYLVVGGDANATEGRTIEMAYYGDAPRLDVTPTWLSERYNRLLISATLTAAMMFHLEDQRAAQFESDTASLITGYNDSHMQSKASGSRLTTTPQRKGFG